MTIDQVLKKYSKIEADLLLGHVLKQPKEFLYMHGVQKLSATQLKRFESLVAKRKAGMPVAYLLGYKYFYDLKFKVSRSVLIPRPETEWLVDEATALLKGKRNAKILDVGTGSGCIAISVAKNTNPKKVKVFASDISTAALKVAKENAKINKAKVTFAKRDLLQGTKAKFDLIIANLPYVPVSDYKKFYNNLRFEPKLALTDGFNDSRLILKLVEQAKHHLNKNGVLLLEMDPKTAKYLKEYKPKIYKDIRGFKRFAEITF